VRINGFGRRWRGRRRGRRETEYAGANFFQRLTMLFIETKLESFFVLGIKRQEIEITIGAAMQHAAAGVNGGVDERAGRAGVFGLHVILVGADADICVMTKDHRDRPRCMTRQTQTRIRTIIKGLGEDLTDW